jgi:hypothetical protein
MRVGIRTGRAHHFDLQQSFITIVQQVTGLSAVNSDNSKKKLSTQTKSHGSRTSIDHDLYAVLEI